MKLSRPTRGVLGRLCRAGRPIHTPYGLPTLIAIALGHYCAWASAAELPLQPSRDTVREYLASVAPDYMRHVVPAVEPLARPTDESADVEVVWVEVARARLHEPEPPPPVVPPGLHSLAWAVQNPAQAWRIVLPIPSEQAPELTLPDRFASAGEFSSSDDLFGAP